MTLSSEKISAHSSIGIQGKTAVGKEESGGELSLLVGKMVVNTGMSIRAATLMAHRLGQFEEGRRGAMRLRPGAADRIADWTCNERSGLHFEPIASEVSARIFFAEADLTALIKPQSQGFVRQSIMEPAAVIIASHPTIRRGFLEMWRTTSLNFGGAIMITKKIDEYLPEAHGLFHLFVSNPTVSAQYRLKRGVAATRSIFSERGYIQRRDQSHTDCGLEDVPERALSIDMTSFLLKKDGFQRVAEKMVDNLQQNFRSRLYG